MPLCLLVLVTWLRPASATPVSVRFIEGVTHGFLVLRTVDGGLIASGDLLQVSRHGQVESRMVFRFKDGSVFDETVVFTQQRVFVMQSYRLSQRGPAFTEDTEASLERASGKYRVNTKPGKTSGRRSSMARSTCHPTSTTAWSSPSRRISPREPVRWSTS